MLTQKIEKPDCSLYKLQLDENQSVESFIATTSETRSIANDPMVMGVEYTDMLENACAKILKTLDEENVVRLQEKESIVFNILRGGLNFGLRHALKKAFGWNRHGCSFISAQRARKDDSPEEWHIIETEYSKVYMPQTASIIIGDVVATGTSLEHAMNALVNETQKQGSKLKSIVFFTFGGKRAAEILDKTDKMCRAKFPEYEKTVLIYHEGCFTVPDQNTPLSIKETGTDLVRLNSIMAPEFIQSQYSDPSFPIQRCTIYDAGSRAFWTPEYLNDLHDYWTKVLNLAKNNTDFNALVKERFPELDTRKFKNPDLADICKKQIDQVEKLLG